MIQNIFKKYKLALITALIVIVLGLGVLFTYKMFYQNSSLKELSTDTYSLKYDKSWQIENSKKDVVELKHKKSDSLIKIEIIDLVEESKYTDIADLVDEILYNIENQNKDYKLITKKEDSFTKSEYKGFKFLYENKDSQVMVATYKKGERLVMISYEASNDYFDILLDSVQNIIYNFNLKEEKYNLTHELNIKESKVDLGTDETIEKNLKNTKSYEIIKNNYYVKYNIPDIFEQTELNTEYQNFEYENENKTIKIDVSMVQRNIYEALEEDGINFIGYSYKYNKDKYDNFKDSLAKWNIDNYDAYIYKVSYTQKATKYEDFKEAGEYDQYHESIILAIAIKNNRLLKIEISSRECEIPKDLLDMIKIEEVKNYATYTTSTKEAGYLLTELKQPYNEDYKTKKVDVVKLKISDNWEERNKTWSYNYYKNKYFALNYDETKELYDYEVTYFIDKLYSEKAINNDIESRGKFSTAYGDVEPYSLIGTQNINDKEFTVYNGSYNYLGGIPYTNINRFIYKVYKKVLYYKIYDRGYIGIEITGNGKEISDDVINQVTSFELYQEDFK